MRRGYEHADNAHAGGHDSSACGDYAGADTNADTSADTNASANSHANPDAGAVTDDADNAADD